MMNVEELGTEQRHRVEALVADGSLSQQQADGIARVMTGIIASALFNLPSQNELAETVLACEFAAQVFTLVARQARAEAAACGLPLPSASAATASAAKAVRS